MIKKIKAWIKDFKKIEVKVTPKEFKKLEEKYGKFKRK